MFYSFTQWLLLIVMAKLGNPEMVGYYALGLAVTAPIVLLTDMELRLALVTDTKNEYLFSQYLGLRLISISLAFVIFFIVILVADFDFYTGLIIVLIGLTKLPASVSDVFHGLMQKNERMDLISISNMVKGILTVIAFLILLSTTGSLMMAVIGQFIIWTIILLVFDMPIVKKFTYLLKGFQLKQVKLLFKLSIPLGFMALLASVNTNVPNYVVEYFLGTEELGYFAALLYVYFAGNRLIDSLRQPTATRLAKLFEKYQTKEFTKFLMQLVLAGFLIGIIGFVVSIVLGEIVLTYIYTPEYAVYSSLFIVIMAAGIFSFPAMFLDTGLIATRHFKLQPFLALLWLSGSIIFCFIFIPSYGLYGAAIAIILTSFLKFISLLIVLTFIVKIRSAVTKYIWL